MSQKPTVLQQNIVDLLKENKDPMSKKDILEMTSDYWFHNSSKHLGDCLSRMVTSGFIYRPSKGVYSLGQIGFIDPNQLSLF